MIRKNEQLGSVSHYKKGMFFDLTEPQLVHFVSLLVLAIVLRLLL
jgi:hypothetical protein